MTTNEHGEQTFSTLAESLAYLMQHGNLAVPCSRWGNNTEQCAAIAYAAARIVADETGEPITARDLDYAMGLAVNDSDDLTNLFADR